MNSCMLVLSRCCLMPALLLVIRGNPWIYFISLVCNRCLSTVPNFYSSSLPPPPFTLLLVLFFILQFEICSWLWLYPLVNLVVLSGLVLGFIYLRFSQSLAPLSLIHLHIQAWLEFSPLCCAVLVFLPF